MSKKNSPANCPVDHERLAEAKELLKDEPMVCQRDQLGDESPCGPAKPKSLSTFFWSCFKISAFTLGGGYVIVPLQKRRFCDELGWIGEEKILDLVSIAQSAPGPVAINASTLMGHHLFGLKGAILAAIATVLPPLLILSVVSLFYEAFATNRIVRAVLSGMQAAVAALIANTVIGMASKLIKTRSVFLIGLLIVCLALALFTKINVVFIILLAALASVIAYGLDTVIERGH